MQPFSYAQYIRTQFYTAKLIRLASYIYTYRELFLTLTAIRRKQILLCESQFVLLHEWMQKEQNMSVDKSSWLVSEKLLFKIYINQLYMQSTQQCLYIPLKILFTYSFEMFIGVNAPSIIRVKSVPVREPKAAAYTHRSLVS